MRRSHLSEGDPQESLDARSNAKQQMKSLHDRIPENEHRTDKIYSTVILTNQINSPAELLYLAVKKNELKQIQQLLAGTSTHADMDQQSGNEAFVIDLIHIVDQKGNSLLHHASINNSFWVFNQLLEYQKQQMYSIILNTCLRDQEKIVLWLDAKNHQGYTALHLACFKGNLQILQKYEEMNGDMKSKNNQGLSMLHIICQCDQPHLLAYVKDYFQYEEITMDSIKSTPLHQACFFGSQACVYQMLAWGHNPNQQDQEGFTPLHLSAIAGYFIQYENLFKGHSRIVRRLLIYGADPNIRDNKGMMAIQVAEENQFENIVEILQPDGGCGVSTFLGVRSVNSIKEIFKNNFFQKKKSLRFIVQFQIMYLMNIAYTVVFAINCIHYDYVFIGFATFVLFLYIYLLQSDPGRFQKGPNSNYFLKKTFVGQLVQLYQQFDSDQICAECEQFRPARSKHCDICKCCVKVYDHHCPWLNNCIGAKNHGIFILFLVLLFLQINAQFAQIILTNLDMKNGDTIYDFQQLIGNTLYRDLRLYVGIGVTLPMLMFYIPTILLVIVQINNLFHGKTTYERYSQRSTSKSLVENDKQCYLVNCINMCAKNKDDPRYNIQDNSSLIQTTIL